MAFCSEIHTEHTNALWAECKILDWWYKG